MRRIEINSLTMVISDYEKYEEGLNPDEVTFLTELSAKIGVPVNPKSCDDVKNDLIRL